MQKDKVQKNVNQYYSDTDLLYIKYAIEKPFLVSESKLTYNHFDDVLAKVLWQMMLKCSAEKNTFIPSVDLQPLFEDKVRREKMAMFMHPIQLTTIETLLLEFRDMSTEESYKNLEATIIERYNRKELKQVASTLMAEAADSAKSSKELLRKYGYKIDMLLDSASDTRRVVTSSDMVRKELEYLNDPTIQEYPSTGTIIDLVNEGLTSPSLTFFLAPQKSGKSTALYNTALNSLRLGRTTLFVTIEISAEETSRKILSSYTKMPFSAINKKKLTEDQKTAYIDKVTEFEAMTEDKLFILDDQEGVSPKDILAYCKHLARAGIIVQDLFIDYLQILTPNNPKMSRVEALSVMSQDLRKLSQQLDVRLFSAQQLHSSSETEAFEDINYDHVYYCKTLGQDTTYAIALRREKDEDTGELRLLQKFLPSRQAWDDRIYYCPDYMPECLYFGEPAIYNDKAIESSNELKGMMNDLGEINW